MINMPSRSTTGRRAEKYKGTMDAISEAQANLPGLCQSGRRFVISRRDKPVYVAMPLEDYDAMLETMEILSNPAAMKTLRAAKAGRLAYKELDLADETFGL